MASAKNQIILEGEEYGEEKKYQAHPNTPDEQVEIASIVTKVNKMYQLQTKKWREFNERSLKDYVDDNEKRINNYVPPRDESFDDWQTKGFEGITREKMFAFVAKVAMQRPKYKFKATKKNGVLDRVVADVVKDFFEYSLMLEDPTSVEFFFDAWAAAGHGTVIRYEGIEQEETVEEEFDSYDIRTGAIKGLKEKRTKGDINCKSRRVRLLDFLWYDWYQPDIQKQPCLAENIWMNRYEFESVYGDYYNAKNVPEATAVAEMWGDSFYMEQWKDAQEGMVNVVRFYEKCKGKTKFRIIANGVLILATPIPRKDGKYPFARGIFKPHADTSFFCGKALPDEIAYDQDLYNAFKNMMIDRAILHIQRPLISDGANEFTDVFMAPNKILSVQGNVQPLDIPGPGAADMQVLDFLRGSIDRQSSDAAQSGQSGSGVTAREIVIADENARKIAGVFRLFLEAFDLDATRLRTGTIMQFYFEPSKIDEVIGDERAEAVYRLIAIPGRKMTDGVTGTQVVQVVGTADDVPLNEDVDAEVLAAEEQGLAIEKRVVSAAYIKQFNIDVLIIPESTFETARSLTLALENEYQRTVAELYPNKFQQYQDIFFRQINDIYDKDMSDFDNAPEMPVPPPMEAPEGGAPVTAELGTQPATLAKMTGTEF